MDCHHCGQHNARGAQMCVACGAALVAGPAPMAAQPIEHVEQAALFDLPAQPAAAVAGAAAALGGQARGWSASLGPADRESFFDAQRRNRRSAWRQIAVCALTAMLVGIPISLMLTPLVFALVIVVTKLVSLLVPVPMAVWHGYDAILRVPIEVFDKIGDSSNASGATDTGSASADDIALAAAVWFLPGILAMLLIWPAIRRLLRSAGTEGVLKAIGARPPRSGDFEERQLVNVVQELALAAGIPAPRVMLLDSSAANAAAVGSSPENAVIVVGRRLLDELDRDETQGVLAHLIASIGNGDLRVATAILAMYQTFGFAGALIKYPISDDARRTVGRVLRFAVGRRASAERAVESEAVARLLTHSVTAIDESDDLGAALARAEAGPGPRPGLSPVLLFYVPGALLVFYIGSFFAGLSAGARHLGIAAILAFALLVVLYQARFLLGLIPRAFAAAHAFIILPYYLGAMLPQLLLLMLVPYLLEPMLALAWRARRYLADATAVQLTRNPDWIAGGLSALSARGGGIPGGRWAAPLFIVGGKVTPEHDLTGAERAELEMLEATLAKDPSDPAEQVSALRRAQAARRDELAAKAAAAERQRSGDGFGSRIFGGGSGAGVVSYFPPLHKRLVRLRRMGSGVDPGRPTRGLMRIGLSRVLRYPKELLFFGLMAFVITVGLVAVVVLAALSLVFALLFMAVVYALLLLVTPA